MPIKIVPHSTAFKQRVLDFNDRMRAGGSKWGFYADPDPDWIPKTPGAKTWREYYLAVENEEYVRGAYALKPQQWLVKGKHESVTDWQGPFSEGVIDHRYNSLALRMMREMLKTSPLLFSLGHGGNDEPIVQLLRTLGWTLYEMPLCIKIVRPFRFFRGFRYLRTSSTRKVAFDALAFSGVGAAGVKAFDLINNADAGRNSAHAIVVASFGNWADELWVRNQGAYACLAVRDREMMNTLLPPKGWPGGTRLKIDDGGKTIGWSVVHRKRMKDDPRFGDLTVGLVSDCFAAPADAVRVIAATHAYLTKLNVDLVFSNQSHPAWVEGFRKSGYLIQSARRSFAVSPQLKAAMEPFEETVKGLHLTNMDGHGPHGFED